MVTGRTTTAKRCKRVADSHPNKFASLFLVKYARATPERPHTQRESTVALPTAPPQQVWGSSSRPIRAWRALPAGGQSPVKEFVFLLALVTTPSRKVSWRRLVMLHNNHHSMLMMMLMMTTKSDHPRQHSVVSLSNDDDDNDSGSGVAIFVRRSAVCFSGRTPRARERVASRACSTRVFVESSMC
jgi:hypothetical protein